MKEGRMMDDGRQEGSGQKGRSPVGKEEVSPSRRIVNKSRASGQIIHRGTLNLVHQAFSFSYWLVSFGLCSSVQRTRRYIVAD